MKVKVTEQGVVIPKTFFEGVEEVEIRQENSLVIVIANSKKDPILEMGMHPVACGLTDASEQPDSYIYGSSE